MNDMQLIKIIVVLYYCAIFVNAIGDLSKKNFGPFKLKIPYMTVCKGPKTMSCADTEIDWTDLNAVRFKVRVHQHVLLVRGKLTTVSKERPNTNLVWRFQNPCAHFFIGPILKTGYNVTPNNCSLSKGLYDFRLNYTRITNQFAGNKFFYGNYTVQVTLMSNSCNVICYSQILTLMPLN